MRNLLIIATTIMVLSASCNNAADNKETAVKTHTDSLMDEVMEGHDEAMGKTNKVSSARKLVQQSLDSIDKLAPKLKQASAAFKIHLDSLSAELKYAESGMDRWMEEFNMDSSKNDIEQRSTYLASEKEKIFKIKEMMASALRKTDSLLKK